MHTEQKVWSNWSLRQQNYLNYPTFTEYFVITWLFSPHVLLWGPIFLWGPLFGRTCWTCLNPPLHTTRRRTVLPSYPPDNHHCSDAVYWSGRGWSYKCRASTSWRTCRLCPSAVADWPRVDRRPASVVSAASAAASHAAVRCTCVADVHRGSVPLRPAADTLPQTQYTVTLFSVFLYAFGASTLLVGRREGHSACKHFFGL